jgi:hypothetical protein
LRLGWDVPIGKVVMGKVVKLDKRGQARVMALLVNDERLFAGARRVAWEGVGCWRGDWVTVRRTCFGVWELKGRCAGL